MSQVVSNRWSLKINKNQKKTWVECLRCRQLINRTDTKIEQKVHVQEKYDLWREQMHVLSYRKNQINTSLGAKKENLVLIIKIKNLFSKIILL